MYHHLPPTTIQQIKTTTNSGARLGADTQQCDGFNRLMGF